MRQQSGYDNAAQQKGHQGGQAALPALFRQHHQAGNRNCRPDPETDERQERGMLRRWQAPYGEPQSAIKQRAEDQPGQGSKNDRKGYHEAPPFSRNHAVTHPKTSPTASRASVQEKREGQ
jgi:hypothetical protein